MTVARVAFSDPVTKTTTTKKKTKQDVEQAAAELLRPLASSRGTAWWVEKGIKRKAMGAMQG